MKIAIIGTTAASILGFRRDLILSLVQQGYQVYTFATDFTPAQKQQVTALYGVGGSPFLPYRTIFN